MPGLDDLAEPSGWAGGVLVVNRDVDHEDVTPRRAALLAEQALGRQPSRRVARFAGAEIRAVLLALLARLDHQVPVSIQKGVLVIGVVLDPGSPRLRVGLNLRDPLRGVWRCAAAAIEIVLKCDHRAAVRGSWRW